MKNIWDITKSVTGKSTKNDTMYELNIIGNVNNSSHDTADSFSMYFLSVMENNFNTTSLKLIITIYILCSKLFIVPSQV